MADEKMTLTERLRNPAYGQEERLVSDMGAAANQIDALRASLVEMVSIYWGAGDGQEPPPFCIQQAQAALSL